MRRFWKNFLRQILGMSQARAYALAAGCVVAVAGLLVLARAERAPWRVHPPVSTVGPRIPLRSDAGNGEVSATLSLAQGAVRAGAPQRFFAQVELEAQARESSIRAPLALAIVLDHSGSMEGIKIVEAKRAVSRFVSGLGPDDYVSFTIYDDHAERVYPLLRVADARGMMFGGIERVRAGGSTNIPEGLAVGMDTLRQAPDGYVRRVVLFSDGLDMSGTPLSSVTAQVRAGSERVTVSALGIGTDYDPAFMSAVAEAGNGNYAFLGNPEMLASFVTRELTESLATLADGAVLDLQLPREIRFVRAVGVDATATGDGVRIPVGTLSRGDRRRIVVELEATLADTGAEARVAAQLTYHSVGTNRAESLRTGALTVVAVATDAEMDASRDMGVWGDLQALLVDEEQERAAQAWREGRPEEARRIANAQRDRLSSVRKAQEAAGIAPSPSLAYQADKVADDLNSYAVAPSSKEGKAMSLQGEAMRKGRAKMAPTDWAKKDTGSVGAAGANASF